jgi:hypothetical protein
MEDVIELFTRTWARQEQEFTEADEDSRFHLNAMITENEEELQGF